MTPMKGFNKCKSLAEDFNDFIEEAFEPEPSKITKTVKRKLAEPKDDKPQTKKYQVSAKTKGKNLELGENLKKVRGKVIDVMEHQIEARKQGNENLMKSLSEVMAQMKADCTVLHNNQQKIQNFSAVLVKCMEQATAAQKQKLEALSEIQAAFKKQSDEIDNDHRTEAKKLAEDIQNLTNKLIAEAKRSGWEDLRKTMFQAMQGDI